MFWKCCTCLFLHHETDGACITLGKVLCFVYVCYGEPQILTIMALIIYFSFVSVSISIISCVQFYVLVWWNSENIMMKLAIRQIVARLCLIVDDLWFKYDYHSPNQILQCIVSLDLFLIIVFLSNQTVDSHGHYVLG